MSDVPIDATPPQGAVLPSVSFPQRALTHWRSGAKQYTDAIWKRLIEVFLLRAQDELIFNPPGRTQELIKEPRRYGLIDFKKEKIQGMLGPLTIWHKQASDPNQPVYVVFHGRKGHWGDIGLDPREEDSPLFDRQYRIKWLKSLADTGAEVIAVHLSGIGASKNNGNRAGEMQFKRDVAAIADYLQEHKIPSNRVMVAGESMGGAVAAMLAVEMTERRTPPAGLGLIASFASLTECIIAAYGKWLSPDTIKAGLKHPLKTEARVSALSPQTSLYLAHALNDTTVPFEHRGKLEVAGEHLNVETRDLTGDYLLRQGYEHINWNPQKIVEDLQTTYRKRQQAEAVAPSNGHYRGNGFHR